MTYSKKTIEYALSPDGAYPVDARSHFESFADAHSNINSTTITTTQTCNYPSEVNKRYYIGQIITTSGPDVWQVVSSSPILNTLQVTDLTSNDSALGDWKNVYWNDGLIDTLRIWIVSGKWVLRSKAVSCEDEVTTIEWRDIQTYDPPDETTLKNSKYSITFASCLSPLKAGGGGGTMTQQQSDWTETDTAQVTFIKNKPAQSSVEDESLKLEW